MQPSTTASSVLDAPNPGQPPHAFLVAFRGSCRPLVLGHVVPDADCLGAALGLVQALREHGADAMLGLPAAGVPKKLRFMVELVPDAPVTSVPRDDRDAVMVVDTAAEKRINFEPRPDFSGSTPSFNIDHHITNTDFARHNWVDPHAASTCELIAGLIRAMGWAPSPSVASLLYAGIHGDTAGFSLPNTSAEALATAADMVRAGADVTHIGEKLCRSQAAPDFELLRRVYDHTTVVADGRIAYSYLTFDDITAARCLAEDIDDQVSIPRALAGVRIAMLFSEGEPGVVRVNLRGEGRTRVLEIAQAFGGGGHTQSAGIRVRNKPMRQVIDDVVEAAVRRLAEAS